MRLFLGVAQDIVVKRTKERNDMQHVAGNLWNHDVVFKYEIENFKQEPVTLDIAENLRHIRNETRGDTGREVDWQLLPDSTVCAPDAERSTAEQLVFHVKLPAADANGKAQKLVHKLHLTIKNEW